MNLFDKLVSKEDRPVRHYGHGGTVKKPDAPEKTAIQKVQDENARLREALHSILMGTKLDRFNRNDDGIVDLLGAQGNLTQEISSAHLKRWANIVATALGKKS